MAKKELVLRNVEHAGITKMHVSWDSKLKAAHWRMHVNAHERTKLKAVLFFSRAARTHDTKGLEA